MIIDKTKGDEYPIPHEVGQYMKIRPLTWQEVKDAAAVMTEATSKRAQELMAGITPESLAALKNESAKAKEEDPDLLYDRATVLGYAIVSWSYPQTVEEGIPNLDERTAKWAFEKAVSLFKRDPDEGEGSAGG